MPTKAELLEQAQAFGLDVTEDNTKAEIEDALERHFAQVDEEAASATPSKVCATCGESAVVTLGGDYANEVSFCPRHLPGAVAG